MTSMNALAVALLLVSTSAVAADGAKRWRPIEHFQVAGRVGAPAVNVTIEANDEAARSDSGASPRARIAGSNEQALIVSFDGGLATIKETVDPPLQAGSAQKSEYVLSGPRTSNSTPLLVFFGHTEASDPGALTVVALDRRGAPILALSEETLSLTFINLTKQRTTLVGMRSFSQLSGSCLSSYDPYSVFLLGPDSRFRYSLALSKAYNLDHYVWAGPTGTEAILVDGSGATPHVASKNDIRDAKPDSSDAVCHFHH